jgi:hypothetical protein
MAINLGPNIVEDGLIVYLDAGNTSSYSGSGTTWTDLKENKNGSLINSPTYSSANNGILSFDGTNDYANITGPNNSHAWTPDNSVGSNVFCYEIWIKTTDSAGYVLSKPWNGSGQYNILVGNSSFSLSAGSGAALSLPTYNDGNWHQLIVWANQTTMGYYLDGGSSSNSTSHSITSPTPSSGNSQLPLGIMTLYFYGSGWSGNTSYSLDADVGIFRKYNRVITSTEAAQNYNATKSRFI